MNWKCHFINGDSLDNISKQSIKIYIPGKRVGLKVREHSVLGPYVDGLSKLGNHFLINQSNYLTGNQIIIIIIIILTNVR